MAVGSLVEVSKYFSKQLIEKQPAERTLRGKFALVAIALRCPLSSQKGYNVVF
jgi:hypothetical protein